MSDGKFLVYGGFTIEKLEEIRKGLEIDIEVEQRREKLEEDKPGKKYGKSGPYREVLSHIDEMLGDHIKDYLLTEKCFYSDDWTYQSSLSEYVDNYPPHWRTLIGESYIKEWDTENPKHERMLMKRKYSE